MLPAELNFGRLKRENDLAKNFGDRKAVRLNLKERALRARGVYLTHYYSRWSQSHFLKLPTARG
jgi:hypothetical protein